jgi:hypothetical protein
MIKKTILMLLVFVGGVMSANAQITESGKIKLYFQNNRAWNTPHLYVKGNNDAQISAPWPGSDISSNTITIDGNTYYYFIVTIPEGVSSVTINFNDGINQQSYDWSGIVYDSFFTISTGDGEVSGTWTKYGLTREEKFYMYDVNSRLSIKLDKGSDTNYSTTIDNSALSSKREFVVASSNAYDSKADIHTSNKWNDVWRPWNEYNGELGFQNISLINNNCFKGGGDNNFKFSAGIKYDFIINVSLDGSNSKFSISSSFTRTIKAAESNGAYYATFSSDYAVAIPTGITAYWANASQTVDGSVNMTSFTNGIPAGVGAFIKMATVTDATNGDEYTFTPAASTDNVTEAGDLLKKTKGYTYDSSKNRYVFAKQGNDVGFYKAGTSYNPSEGKAYLELPTTTSGAPSLSIELDGETTGIKVINLEENENNGQVYDLQGRRVAEPTKGIYIVNGKKVIVK